MGDATPSQQQQYFWCNHCMQYVSIGSLFNSPDAHPPQNPLHVDAVNFSNVDLDEEDHDFLAAWEAFIYFSYTSSSSELSRGSDFFGDFVDGGNKGAPPAAKETVMGLETVVITGEEEAMVCVICSDAVKVGESLKKLPCRHGYHGHCIEQWLELKNSCPVCRFELPTDDPEYEIERKKKINIRTMDGVVDGNTSDVPARVGRDSTG